MLKAMLAITISYMIMAFLRKTDVSMDLGSCGSPRNPYLSNIPIAKVCQYEKKTTDFIMKNFQKGLYDLSLSSVAK